MVIGDWYKDRFFFRLKRGLLNYCPCPWCGGEDGQRGRIMSIMSCNNVNTEKLIKINLKKGRYILHNSRTIQQKGGKSIKRGHIYSIYILIP